MSEQEKAAWALYCEDTAGDAHVADFWEELSDKAKDYYMEVSDED